MALDWNAVKQRYENGADVEPIPGAATLSVTGADDNCVYVKHRLWSDRLVGFDAPPNAHSEL